MTLLRPFLLLFLDVDVIGGEIRIEPGEKKLWRVHAHRRKRNDLSVSFSRELIGIGNERFFFLRYENGGERERQKANPCLPPPSIHLLVEFQRID